MLKLLKDNRIGNVSKYYISEKEVNPMQIPPEIKKCVCFIYCLTSDENKELLGTGFFLKENLTNTRGVVYCITAKHILEGVKKYKLNKDNEILLRVNLTDGGSTYFSSKIDDWTFNTDNDIAVLFFEPDFDLDILFYASESIIDESIISEENINIGDEIFIAGVFSKYHEETSNIIPIMRFGNISAMIEEKVRVKDIGLIDAYLIETHSIGGLSGSPVFINIESGRYDNKGNFKLTFRNEYKFYLLGIITAHFDWKTESGEAGIEEKIENINMGIAVVTPATKIRETLNYPQLLEIKRKEIKKIEDDNAAILD